MTIARVSIDANSRHNTWLTSDLHFGHRNVIGLCARPFAGVGHMHQEMIRLWNDIVAPGDLVIIVGDFSLSTKDAVTYGPLLKGAKWLVPGNHDSMHSSKKMSDVKRADTIKAYEDAGFQIVPEEFMLDTAYGEFYVRHLPYLVDGDVDVRYKEMRTVEPYNLICGHVHEKWKAKRHANGKAMVNVGVDQWNFRPISLRDVANAISGLTP